MGSIQAALNSAQPGDAVTLRPGVYNEVVSTVRGGTAASRITLRTQNNDRSARITAPGRVLSVNHPYFVVQGVVIDGQYGANDTVKVGNGGDYFWMTNTEVLRSSRDCIDMAGPDDVTIENSLVHHCLWYTTERLDAHAIVTGPVRNLTIRGSEMHTFTGDAFQADPGRDAPGWDNILIENCRAWLQPMPVTTNGVPAGVSPGENVVDTKTITSTGYMGRITIRNVQAWGFKGGISNQAAFNLKERVIAIVDRVTVFDSEIAFRTRGPSADVTITNAVVYDTLKFNRYEDNIIPLRIYNATVGSGVPTIFQRASSPSTMADVRNFLVLGTALPAEAPAGNSNLAVSSSAFVNAGAHDYHLATGSPAIDQGDVISGVDADRDGLSRPRGAAPDIGAYEK